MRVISGTARGRKLREPVGEKIRPTSDKVKESIFNIIQFEIEGRRVLDLYAGTGQLGIEALSRGAEFCVFVDSSQEAINLARQNVAACGFLDRAAFVRASASSFLRSSEKHDIIFLDPPYMSEGIEKSLAIINEIDILKENGIIVCETKAENVLPVMTEPYFLRREYRYGSIKIAVYSRKVDS